MAVEEVQRAVALTVEAAPVVAVVAAIPAEVVVEAPAAEAAEVHQAVAAVEEDTTSPRLTLLSWSRKLLRGGKKLHH